MPILLPNPFWHALTTEQASIAIGSGASRRYPADVIPFGGLAEDSPEALRALAELLSPGESIYLASDADLPAVRELQHMRTIPGFQMHHDSTVDPNAATGAGIDPLGAHDAAAMVGLTDVAFPGFFRARTYVLGAYFGIRVGGVLIAMAGERVSLPGYREISAVCTHPDHTGRGYAARLIRHLLRVHAEQGVRSFLHVSATNNRAIDLYERLGFVRTGSIYFHQLLRV